MVIFAWGIFKNVVLFITALKLNGRIFVKSQARCVSCSPTLGCIIHILIWYSNSWSCKVLWVASFEFLFTYNLFGGYFWPVLIKLLNGQVQPLPKHEGSFYYNQYFDHIAVVRFCAHCSKILKLSYESGNITIYRW